MMSKKKDKTPEQTPAPAEDAVTQQTEAPVADNSFTVTKPDQKTINVVGGVVIATLVAIVIAQAVGDNNELSSSQTRLPNGQFQTPGQQGPGGMPGQGMQGPGMQGPGMQGPGMQDPDADSQDQDNTQPAPRSRAS